VADTVKTSILKEIKIFLEGLTYEGAPLFNKVLRNPSIPIDHDCEQHPIIYFFDDTVKSHWRNRLIDATMPIIMEVWLRTDDRENSFEDISDEADIIEAEVQKAVMNIAPETGVKKYAKLFEPQWDDTSTKFYVDEFIGGITLNYMVRWLYKWNNPYDIVST
jgi:hypothetical protein